jgi:hypothetical protein
VVLLPAEPIPSECPVQFQRFANKYADQNYLYGVSLFGYIINMYNIPRHHSFHTFSQYLTELFDVSGDIDIAGGIRIGAPAEDGRLCRS